MRTLKSENRESKTLPLVHVLLTSIFLFLVSGTGSTFAGDNSIRPIFTLTLADGTTVSGNVEQIGDNWSIRMAGAQPREAAEVVSLRRDKIPIPPSPHAEQIILANGDRLPATIQELIGDRLRVHGDLGQEGDFALPISSVSVIWITAPDGVEHPDKWRRRLLVDRRSHDTVYLRNGEIIEGIVNSIVAAQGADAPRSGTLQIESGKKDVAVPLKNIAVVAFNTGLIRNLQPKGVHGRLVLDNGVRLTLASAWSDGHVITGKTVFGGDVSIPLHRVIALDWLGGCVVYLSDLKPRSYEFRSFLGGVDWPYVKDSSVAEGDIRLGGRLYDKGIGVHSACRLTYAVDADVNAFEAMVGMDDLVGKEGSARIQVLLDAKPQKLAWDGMLAGGSKPRNVRVPISGAKEITLVTDFGDFGDVQGCVDWADARFIRKEKIEHRK